MVCHIQLFTAGAFLPVLGFVIFPCFVMDAMLMFKHRNGFGLNMVADRAVTCFGAFFGLGGRLRHAPFAVGMVCHIQLFTTGTLLPVISIIIFPCFIMDAVYMDRNRLFLRIFADGAGALPGTLLRCGGRLRHAPFAVGMVCHIQLFTTGTLLPVIGVIFLPAIEDVFMGGSRTLSTTAGAFKCSPVTPFSWAGNVFVGKLSDNDAASRPYFNCVIFASLRHQAAIKQMISLYCKIGTVNYCLAELQPKLVLILAAARGRVPLYHAFRALCPSYVLGHTCACRQHDDGHHCRHHA